MPSWCSSSLYPLSRCVVSLVFDRAVAGSFGLHRQLVVGFDVACLRLVVASVRQRYLCWGALTQGGDLFRVLQLLHNQCKCVSLLGKLPCISFIHPRLNMLLDVADFVGSIGGLVGSFACLNFLIAAMCFLKNGTEYAQVRWVALFFVYFSITFSPNTLLRVHICVIKLWFLSALVITMSVSLSSLVCLRLS